MTRMQKFHPEFQEEPPKRITRMERFAHLREEPEKPETEEHLDNLERRAVLPRSENQENGRKVLDVPSVRRQMMNSFTGMVQPRPALRHEREQSREKLFSDCGVRMLNKGELIGQPNRPIEDHGFIAEQKNMFAVFDGAGGVRGGAEASSAATHKLSELTWQGQPKTKEEMAGLMMKLNEAVMEAPNAGVTTAVIGHIMEGQNGKKSLLWASVGDSRIYQTRGGSMRQLTKDEGEGNRIYNCLGHKNAYVKQVGVVDLEEGDSLLFCSDGITGDYEKDFIPEPELYRLIAKPPTAQEAADALVRRATKRDDRVALVVRI